jgi:chromate reductase
LNGFALELAREVTQGKMSFERAEISSLPFFEPDFDIHAVQEPVRTFEACLARADGVILACPEYNHSVPAMVKNAIDWASRLPARPLRNKPVMILSATTGILGGARVQYEIRRILDAVEALPLARPEVFIGMAHEKFSSAGKCTDAATRTIVNSQLEAFSDWIHRTRQIGACGARKD